MIRFTIPIQVPSQNETDRMHWRARNRLVQTWKIWARVAASTHPKAAGKRKVHILAVRKRLITDRANLVGGCKGLVDALTHAGLILDDSDDLADIAYFQETAKGRAPHTVITIEDAP